MLGARFFSQFGRKKRTDDKFRPAMESSSHRAACQEFAGWRIEITENQVGVTVARRTYSASLTQNRTRMHKFFSGFASEQTALAAAHARITELNQPAKSKNSQNKVCGQLKKS